MLIEILKWIPAISFPTSYIFQMIKIVNTKKSAGINNLTFFLYFLGNIASLLFINRLSDIRTLLAFALTGTLQMTVVLLSLYYRNSPLIWYYGLVSGFLAIFTLYMLYNYKPIINRIAPILGWIPAIIFPVGTLLQLLTVIQTKDIKNVSIEMWISQFIGNIGAYFLTEKLYNIKSILAFLVTAFINLLILYNLISRSYT